MLKYWHLRRSSCSVPLSEVNMSEYRLTLWECQCIPLLTEPLFPLHHYIKISMIDGIRYHSQFGKFWSSTTVMVVYSMNSMWRILESSNRRGSEKYFKRHMTKPRHAYRLYKRRSNFAWKKCQILLNAAIVIWRDFPLVC